MRALASGLLVVAATVVGCGRHSGVDTYAGWRRALSQGSPCVHLFDLRDHLPASVDRARVNADLDRVGCHTPKDHRTDR